MTATDPDTGAPVNGQWVEDPVTGDMRWESNYTGEGEWVEDPVTGDEEWVYETTEPDAPVVITAPTDGATVPGDVPVVGTAPPNAAVTLTVEGDVPGGPYSETADENGDFTFAGNGAVGPGDWTFRVTDGSTEDSVDVHVDVPPEPEP